MNMVIEDSKSKYHAKYYQNNKDKLKYKAKWRQYVNKEELLGSKRVKARLRHKICFIRKRTVLVFD
jgi:hypothetical protein